MNTGFDIQVEESSEEPYSRGFNAYTVSSLSCCCCSASAVRHTSTLNLPKCNLNTVCLAVSIPQTEVALFSVFVRFDGIRPQGSSSKSIARCLLLKSSCCIQSHQNCCSRDPTVNTVESNTTSQQSSPGTAVEVVAKSLYQNCVKTFAIACLFVVCMKSLESISGVRCPTANDPKSAAAGVVIRPTNVATEIELPTLRPIFYLSL